MTAKNNPATALKSSAITALNAFREHSAKIRAEREATAAEIGKLRTEIKRLQDMPVSRADFSFLLKEHIAAQAEQASQRLFHALTDVKKDFHGDGIETDSYNKRGMQSLETRNIKELGGSTRPEWLFAPFQVAYQDFLSPKQLSDGAGMLYALCYLFPDVIHDRIMQTVNERIGEKWGNDELPSVAERRETIADLQTEINSLTAKLAELDAAIAEFNGQTAEKA